MPDAAANSVLGPGVMVVATASTASEKRKSGIDNSTPEVTYGQRNLRAAWAGRLLLWDRSPEPLRPGG